MNIFRRYLTLLAGKGLAGGLLFLPVALSAQNPSAEAEAVKRTQPSVSERLPAGLPVPVSNDDFAALRDHSPFLRSLNLSNSLIITGIARIEEETVATVLDLETRRSFALSQGKTNPEGWNLVEVNGDPSDIETLTAKIKIAGGTEVISIRYEKAPPPAKNSAEVKVSTKIGNGTSGGGTNPHGGPDPRVLTPDQLSDARNAARDIRTGFKADGYADNETIPPEVVSKISRLSIPQRESVNVKMYEYRNRGLGMQERQKIYNNLLDQELQKR